jgi:hypothetical protein
MFTIIVVIAIVIPTLFGVFILYILARPALAALQHRRNLSAQKAQAVEVLEPRRQVEPSTSQNETESSPREN